MCVWEFYFLCIVNNIIILNKGLFFLTEFLLICVCHSFCPRDTVERMQYEKWALFRCCTCVFFYKFGHSKLMNSIAACNFFHHKKLRCTESVHFSSLDMDGSIQMLLFPPHDWELVNYHHTSTAFIKRLLQIYFIPWATVICRGWWYSATADWLVTHNSLHFL